jgi:Tfp pilus assembly protein PilV
MVRARLGDDEAGFTIIEVLVAAIILVLGAIGIFLSLVAGIHNVQRAKNTQVAADIAQREMERLHSLTFEQLALTEAPEHSTEAASPNSRVNSARTKFNVKRTGTAEERELVISSAKGKVAPGPVSGESASGASSFNVDGVSGKIYRYIVWEPEEALKKSAYCTEHPAATACTTSSQGFKQAIIAVWLEKLPDAGSHRPTYYELQSDFVDPEPG